MDTVADVAEFGPLERMPVRIEVTPVRVRADRSGATLRWQHGGKSKWVPGADDALLRFSRLRRAATAAECVSYAERWGVLGEVPRKRFASRAAFTAAFAAIDDPATPAPMDPRWRLGREPRALGDDEPLWLWQIVAAKTRALAVLYVALVGGRPALETDHLWRVATVDYGTRPSSGARHRDRLELLQLLLEDWGYAVGGLQESLGLGDWRGEPAPSVSAVGPVGAALSLLWVAHRLQMGLAVCAHPKCAEPYLPHQKPSTNPQRKTFCPDHRTTGPTLLSKWKKRGVLDKHLNVKEDGDV